MKLQQESDRPRRWAQIRNGIREVYRTLKREHFFSLVGLTALVLSIASVAIYLLEYKKITGSGYFDSLWWALVTITTVGYGDIVPKTLAGRLIGLAVVFSGLVLLSMLTATIASVFVTRKIKEGKGLEDIRDRDHIVICGWNPNGLAILKGLEQHLRPNLPVVVLVNNLPRDEVDAIMYHYPDMQIRFVRGNFTKEEILARANVKRARSAIILADTAGGYPPDNADERTVFGCMAIKTLAPKVKTCAELLSAENREHLVRAKVDEIFVRGEYGAAILASAATTTGLSTVMKGLLDLDEPNKLWRAEIPERLIGQTVAELSQYFREKFDGLLIALVAETAPIGLEDILSEDATAIDDFIRRKFQDSGREYFSSKGKLLVQINPALDTLLTRSDAAIVLSRHRPSGASLLEKSLDLVSGGRRGEDR